MNEEYVLLFRGITETIHSLVDMTERLKELQQAAERSYVEGDANPCECERHDTRLTYL
jgi:hypothetical protein